MNDLYKKIENLKKSFFRHDIFEISLTSNNSFIYNETVSDNKGQTICIQYNINTFDEAVVISNIEDKLELGRFKFNHLINDNSSDIILIYKNNNGYKLSILEIKSSITDKILSNISNQLIFGYLRAMAVLSPLHLNINEVSLYVAFYKDDSITRDISKINNVKLRMHDIPYWKQDTIYLINTIDNNFFNKNKIPIKKIVYDNYTLNNNRAIINI